METETLAGEAAADRKGLYLYVDNSGRPGLPEVPDNLIFARFDQLNKIGEILDKTLVHAHLQVPIKRVIGGRLTPLFLEAKTFPDTQKTEKLFEAIYPKLRKGGIITVTTYVSTEAWVRYALQNLEREFPKNYIFKVNYSRPAGAIEGFSITTIFAEKI